MTFPEKGPGCLRLCFLFLFFFCKSIGWAQSPVWHTVVDTNGRTVLQIVAENVKELTPKTLGFRYEGKWGLVSFKQQYLSANIYDTVESLQGQQIIVGHHGAYFLLDESGKQTEPGTISKYFTVKSGLFYRTAGEWFHLSYGKKELTRFGYFQARQLNDSLVELKDGKQTNWWVAGKGLFLQRAQPGGTLCVGNVVTIKDKGLTYIMTKSGQYILPSAYQEIQVLSDTVFEVTWEKDKKLVDVRGNTILNLDSSLLFPGSVDLFLVFVKGKIGLADGSGCMLVPAEYDSLRAFPEEQTALGLKGKKLFLVEFKSHNRPQSLPLEYWKVNFRDGYAAVKKGAYFGFIDRLGMFRIAPRYDTVFPFINGLAKVKMAGKWGVINKRDVIVIQPIHEKAELSHQKIMVEKEGLMGCYDLQGKLKIPLVYDSMYALNSNHVAVKKNQKWGLIDFRGNQLIGLKYEGIMGIYDTYAIVKREGKHTISKLKAGLVSELVFDQLKYLHLTGYFVGTKT